MEIIVFEKEAYWKIQAELLERFRQVIQSVTKTDEDWISTEEAKKLLGVKSKSKMQQLRDNDSIKFSKHGRKLIKYSKASILKYLNDNIPKH